MGNCMKTKARNASHAPEDHSTNPEGEKENMVTIRIRKKKKHKSCSNDHGDKGEDEVGGDVGETRKGGGVRRVRVVVTREELKHILRHREDLNCTSLKQLVGVVRLKEGSRVPQIGESGQLYVNWRPALESIPEEH